MTLYRFRVRLALRVKYYVETTTAVIKQTHWTYKSSEIWPSCPLAIATIVLEVVAFSFTFRVEQSNRLAELLQNYLPVETATRQQRSDKLKSRKVWHRSFWG